MHNASLCIYCKGFARFYLCVTMRVRVELLSLLVVVFAMTTGCSKQKLPADLPKLYPCRITITDMDGKPLEKVVISVNPEDKTNKWGANGETNASGVADIMTSGQYKGLAEGKYNITLTAIEYLKTGKLDDTGQEILEPKMLMSPEYADSAKTPLKFEMAAKSFSETFKVKR